MGYGGEWEQAQFWLVLSGLGRFVHGETGAPIPAANGHMEHFTPGECRLFIAESEARLLIIEANEFRFDGPWAEWQNPGRTVVRHQSS